MNLGKKLSFSLLILLLVVAFVEATSWVAIRAKGMDPGTSYRSYYRDSTNPDFTFANMQRFRKGFRRTPFFGYSALEGNNFGFHEKVDFPYVKKPDEYVIGIFGGSVADLFAHQVQLDPFFRENLPKYVPRLRGKKIVLLDFAMGGYKQPQQFIVLSYFFETIDAVIQIDGWNEAWDGNWGAFPLNFPSLSEVFYSDDSVVLRGLDRLNSVYGFSEGLRRFLARSPLLSKSNLLYLFERSTESYLASRSIELMSYARTDNHRGGGAFYKKKLSLEEEAGIREGSWEKYLRFEAELARAAHKPAAFFLQPNQYVPGFKPLTEREKRDCYHPANYQRAAEIFSRFRERIPALKAVMPVYDLNGIYAHETRDVLLDDCCHVNDLGNRLMAKKILEVLRDHF